MQEIISKKKHFQRNAIESNKQSIASYNQSRFTKQTSEQGKIKLLEVIENKQRIDQFKME